MRAATTQPPIIPAVEPKFMESERQNSTKQYDKKKNQKNDRGRINDFNTINPESLKYLHGMTDKVRLQESLRILLVDVQM